MYRSQFLFACFFFQEKQEKEALTMEQKKIDRINELARKAKKEPLTAAEIEERDLLRREYIDSVVGSLRVQLDNTYTVDRHGNKTRLRKREEA